MGEKAESKRKNSLDRIHSSDLYFQKRINSCFITGSETVMIVSWILYIDKSILSCFKEIYTLILAQ
jgi:hypothetical protein